MSDDLNEDESNALLRDLENRAGKPSAAAVAAADDDEDIEAFLRSLESEDAPARPTQVAEKPPAKPLPIKEAPKADMVVKPEVPKAKEAKAKKSDEAKKTEELTKADDPKTPGAQGKKAVVLKFLGKAFLILTPTLALWWLLGAYLAQWISAWWLILTIASLVTIAVPVALKVLSKRGQMGWWFAGISLLLTLLLTVPLPSTAASALASYGHWPATSLEASGALSPGSTLSSASQWTSLKIAQLLAPGEYAAFRLGTETPLVDPVPVDPPAGETPAPEVPKVEAPAPIVETPEVKTPEVEIPVVNPPATTEP